MTWKEMRVSCESKVVYEIIKLVYMSSGMTWVIIGCDLITIIIIDFNSSISDTWKLS